MLLLFVLYYFIPLTTSKNPSFVIDKTVGCFRKDGNCFQIISGSIHYYRVPKYYWRDRLSKLKAAGFNTVQTYIPWNIHQPILTSPTDFTGNKDLWSYLDLCKEMGLLVLIRPGPFIASEFEFGGFPSWLLNTSPTISFRSSERVYYHYVESWFEYLLPKLKPYLYNNKENGPIIGVQVENEYGSNPLCDKLYMSNLTELFKSLLEGHVMLYSVDGPGSHMMECGSNPELYNTVDFGSGGNASKNFDTQDEYNKGNCPNMNSEFYPGWLSHWGSKFPHVPSAKVAAGLDNILSMGASVNMYMFHGGTNFGFTSGAKGNADASLYVPHTTSYDYNAPLSEAGDTTEKYWRVRDVIRKYNKVSTPPANTTKVDLGTVSLKPIITALDPKFLEKCGSTETHDSPLSFEELDQINGMVVYSTAIEGEGTLTLPKIRDRAYIYQDGHRLALVKGSSNSSELRVSKGNLDIIVISDGHINTGHVHMTDPRLYMKGILGRVTLNGDIVDTWRITQIDPELKCLLADNSIHMDAARESHADYIPTVYLGTLDVQGATGDTFLDTSGWGKGVAYLGRQNLGRYWPLAGPQVNLFVPQPYLGQDSSSKVLMFEFERPNANFTVSFVAEPNLNGKIDKSQL